MQDRQWGFSLIELMIVVAIIGILAAIAIPQYNEYTTNAQASEGPTLVDGLKTPIVELIANGGNAACTTANLTVTGAVMSGRYVQAVTAAPSGASACDLTVTYKAAPAANPAIAGTSMVIIYDSANGSWTCASWGGSPANKPKICP